jgi:hypothetical protein
VVTWIILFLLDVLFWVWLLRFGGSNSWLGRIILRSTGFFHFQDSPLLWLFFIWGIVGNCIYFILSLFTTVDREDELTIFAWFTIITHFVIFICGIMSDDFQTHYFS